MAIWANRREAAATGPIVSVQSSCYDGANRRMRLPSWSRLDLRANRREAPVPGAGREERKHD